MIRFGPMTRRLLVATTCVVCGLVTLPGPAAAATPKRDSVATRPAPAARKPARVTGSTAVRTPDAPRATSPRAGAGLLSREGAIDPLLIGPRFDTPHRGRFETLAFGGHAELRAADDRVAGVSNPDWMSVPRISGFATLRVHPRIVLAGEATFDRVTDDLVLERALVKARAGRNWYAHAGVLQPPLGRVNTDHDAPENEFDRLSYVATELIGVPNPQLGIGVYGMRLPRGGAPWTWELDLVSGYDEGVVTEAPHGTRLPMGRNNFGTNSGSWGFAGRLAMHPAPETEVGVSAFAGAYQAVQIDGVSIDPSSAIGLLIADARGRVFGLRLSAEAAAATIDVAEGLEGLYAERQWAASVEVARTLREPVIPSWRNTALGAALRGDAVDYDAGIAGDSKVRISATLNLRQLPRSVLRSGWYYEFQRDRFDNLKPAAGLAFSLATYF